MKKFYFIALILFSAKLVFAQFYWSANQIVEKSCSLDSNITVNTYQDLLFYQTINDKWDGEKDSSICVNLSDDGFIEQSSIDTTRSIFIQYLLKNYERQIQPSSLYNIFTQIEFVDSPGLLVLDSCDGEFCSQSIIQISYLAVDNINRDSVIYTYPFNQEAICDVSECHLTPKPEETLLENFIVQLRWDFETFPEMVIKPLDMYYEEGWFYNVLEDENYAALQNDTFQYHVYDVMGVLHTIAEYPSANNISFKEFYPTIEQGIQQDIFLKIDQYSNLVFQDFTSIRGGLVEGDDSIRHNLFIEDNSLGLCLTLIELVFEGGDKFIAGNNTTSMREKMSCMRFGSGGSLVIPDKTTYNYGSNGRGMMALMDGGKIEMGNNSTLLINNTVSLMEKEHDDGSQFYVNLEQGNKIIFGENAHLTNQYSVDGKMKFNVYMNGGILDDSNLNEEEKRIINRIYTINPKQEYDVNLYPNPTQDFLVWEYFTQNPSNVKIQILDMNGNNITSRNKSYEEGLHTEGFDLRGMVEGMYILKWDDGVQEVSHKFIKIR